MLASITPLGERGRRSSWGVTVSAFLIGAVAASAAEGALLGAIGGFFVAPHGHVQPRLMALALGLVVALALELPRGAAPGPSRQVNERWLDEFRGWVYGLGFGAQLGLGITTVVSSAATYVALLAAILTASPARGALVVGCFGAVRGLTPLAAARVHRPDQLMALHASLQRWRRPAERLWPATLVALLALAMLGVLT